MKQRNFPGRTIGSGLVITAVGYAVVQVNGLYGAATIAGGIAVSGLAVTWWWRGRTSTQRTVGKWSRRQARNDGTASAWDHIKVSGRLAMLRQARTIRPTTFGDMSWWRLLRVPVAEYAVELARVGRHTVYGSHEDVSLLIGGPRTGKTGALMCDIVDAPGAVVATSTRTDIYRWTAPIRAKRGPIHAFNPSGLGGIATTVKWSPLIGCRIPAVAHRRADDMIPVSDSSEGERWDIQARRVLRVLMHAAALDNRTMRSVLGWVARPDQEAMASVLAALEKSPDAAAMKMDAGQFFTTNVRTLTSITATLMPALSWLTDSRAASIGDVPVDGDSDLLDVPELIKSRGTIYLLGAKDGMVAPLITALTAEIAHQARLMAAGMLDQRLDPPLALCLDEMARICRIPLQDWSSDMGGYGITIHGSFQSRAQIRSGWGDDAAAVILNNAAAIIVYGGARDPDDLAAWSALSGERDEIVETHDADGKVTSRTSRRIPVLSPAQIANMRRHYAMIIRRGMPVSVGRPRLAWKRRDIKRALKAAGGSLPAVEETNYEEQLREEQLREEQTEQDGGQ